MENRYTKQPESLPIEDANSQSDYESTTDYGVTKELHTQRLWSPLFPTIFRKDEWGSLEMEAEDLTTSEIVEYHEIILEQIEREKLTNEGDRGLAIYLDDSLKKKVYSVNPTVEEWEDKLWGVTEVKSYGELTSKEYDELILELTGQFSDGWGEGFEQRPLKTDEGELYISFWDSSNEFIIKPEDEFKNEPSQGFSMTMGGM